MAPAASPGGAAGFLHGVRAELEPLLAELVGAAAPGRLGAAMRHAVLGPADAPRAGAGGKRLRPALCLAVAEGAGGAAGRRSALAAAAALELVHAYSLVHDDLPCMDDDPVRRGAPATHVAFGPATAARAGLALLLTAFRTLAEPRPDAPPAPVRAALVRVLAEAAGARGLVGGQWIDLAARGTALRAGALEVIQERKTGALFRAAAACGAIAAGAAEDGAAVAARYGAALGLAFQLLDDLRDAPGPAAGDAAARARVAELGDEALALARALDARGEAAPVVLMVRAVLAR